ncbi:site-specific integrase [Pseudoalteromonas spongiae]|uniref:site-specific integrase n=1 Tax=Pseudoalteromonas spongiae TaxID=298657 RepID=UPI0014862A99|nr:site-specific integrase [Pseudoalteromonas spongiae]
MKPIIDGLYYEGKWKASSIEQYVKTWREFYQFLSSQGVYHEMNMPETIKVKIHLDSNSNFLSHTSYANTKLVEKESAINQNWKITKTDFTDNVLSMGDFWLLYSELYNRDPVYAVMAYANLVTCLRVTPLVNGFPLGSNKLNPKWKTYRELKRDLLSTQSLFYVAKGGKVKSLKIPTEFMSVFYNIYENPDKGIKYTYRLQKYRNNYCKTKHAKNSNRTPTQRPTWLLSNGTPVSTRDYQKVMKESAENCNFKCHPHMLRHTGVTQMLYRYLKLNGFMDSISLANSVLLADAQAILQQHLGHVSIETTKKYLRTILRLIQESRIDALLNTALSTSKAHHDMLNDNPVFLKGLELLESIMENQNVSFL